MKSFLFYTHKNSVFKTFEHIVSMMWPSLHIDWVKKCRWYWSLSFHTGKNTRTFGDLHESITINKYHFDDKMDSGISLNWTAFSYTRMRCIIGLPKYLCPTVGHQLKYISSALYLLTLFYTEKLVSLWIKQRQMETLEHVMVWVVGMNN